MGRIIYASLLFTLQSACYGQFTTGVAGMYMTADVGMWEKVLVLNPDSTYYFSIDTDIGGDYIEPSEGTSPKWTFNEEQKIIILHSTKDYKPKDNYILWDTTRLLSKLDKQVRKWGYPTTTRLPNTSKQLGKIQKVWKKIADIDSIGNVSTFVSGSSLVKFSNNYTPVYSIIYDNNKQSKLITNYWKLEDNEAKEFEDQNFRPCRGNKDLYSKVRCIQMMIEVSFPVESRERKTEKGSEFEWFDKEGNEIIK